MNIVSRRILTALVLSVPLLGVCGKAQGDRASVNVLGVNYTAGEFRYRIEDPANPKNASGGELIDSFSGGGIRCCFELPRQWRPGIKVRIHTTLFELPPPPNDSIDNLKEIRNSTEAEVPPYVDGKVGDLWVVRNADGSFGVVSSSYQPDHAKWPGAVKGWPVPSVEYRRARWDLYIHHAEGGVRTAESLLAELRDNPPQASKSAWEFEAKEAEPYRRTEKPVAAEWYLKAKAKAEFLDSFSGPADPRFLEWLRQDYERFLRNQRQEVKQLKDSRP